MWVNDTSEDNFYPDSAATRKTDKSEANIIEDLKLRTEVALSVCKKNI